MTLSHFRCERCRATRARPSRYKNLMERIFTPPPIVSYVRCVKCGRRYPAIGLGDHRIVVREKTKGNTWIAAATVFFMGLVFLAVSYYAYRNFGPN